MPESFLEELVVFTSSRVYGPDDFLCLKSDICRVSISNNVKIYHIFKEMFIVENGILIEFKTIKHIVRKLSRGSSFGELSLM